MTKKAPVYYYDAAYNTLNEYIKKENYTGVFILTDKNTTIHCLPILKKQLQFPFTTIEIPAGEEYKNLTTCTFIWQQLTDFGADRQSLLINLGGGVVTDIGGFTAATFKRGISFINIPTSLLGMVDAAIGNKTGIDFQHLKNHLGVFAQTEMILIDPFFLATLPPREFCSGLAEVIKYGLIDDINIWNYVKSHSPNKHSIEDNIIEKAVQIKESIVMQDPGEKGLRKVLNFGHTLGHALETHFLQKGKEQLLCHGEAIAVGMILAAYLSHKITRFPLNKVAEIATHILKIFPKINLSDTDCAAIISLLQHDKKTKKGEINFVLLEAVGKPIIDCYVPEKQLIEAFNYYRFLSLNNET